MTTFNFPVDTSRLLRAIETPDDVGAVLRIHFEIDRAFTHVIAVMILDPSLLKHRYMWDRIRFLRALGLPEARTAPAKIINEIRNKFAHEAKEELSSSDIDKLADSIRVLIGKEIPADFSLMHKNTQREWRYGTMTLKEKFCLLGCIALAAVSYIENDFEKTRFTEAHKS